jgi:hypothetical protein
MSVDVPVIYSFEGGPSGDGRTLLIKATGFDASVTSFAIPIDNVKHFIAFLLAWVAGRAAFETVDDRDIGAHSAATIAGCAAICTMAASRQARLAVRSGAYGLPA